MQTNMELEKGLNNEEVNARIAKGLDNGSFHTKTKSIGQILFQNIFTLFNFVNIGLAVAVLLVHSYRNMLFLGVVLWNMGIGIFQEIQAKRVIDKLSLLSQPKATVLRNGEKIKIDNSHLVQDDILILESGNQICADSIIVGGSADVNESLISGESNPMSKSLGDEILSGSFIVSGSVKAKVIHVGRENYVDKIIGDTKYIKKPNSEILKSTKFIIKVVSICLLPIMMILFCKQRFGLSMSLRDSVLTTVAAVVGMIPNGLMLLSTCVLAVGVVRLGKHKTLVQDLYCIETLARVDMLCLDKTGTITEGVMELDEVVPVDNHEMSKIEEAIVAFAHQMPDMNPTITAIRDKYSSESNWEIERSIAFSSANKWSLASFKNKGAYILGAPENVLKDDYDRYQDAVNKYICEGNRVLIFAKSDEKLEQEALPAKIEALAFLVINEKIRDNAQETLGYFRKQGVSIKVISGDNPITVSNIAKRAGLEEADNYIDARTISDDQSLSEISEQYAVFGRVTPYQKLALVKAMKKNGHTVAMTGDGINDVLALKEADCSIAMESGSDAARSSSQLVLMDSNFASMPEIVNEGRRSINNLERSATLYLVKTIYASLLAIIFIFLPFPYPLSPIQLTLIGSFAIGIPSFILALEPNFERIKGKFLVNVFRIAIPGGVLVVTNVLITMILTYNIVVDHKGGEIAMLSTMFGKINPTVSTMAAYSTIITSMIILFHICTPFNKMKIGLFTILTGGFLIATMCFRNFFGLVDLTLIMDILLICLGGISFGIFLLYKKLINYIIDKLGF